MVKKFFSTIFSSNDRRGAVYQKMIDRYLGFFILLFLIPISFFRKNSEENQLSIGLLCYGAIGDLLLVSEVAKKIKSSNADVKFYIFCTSTNKAAVELYESIYMDSAVINLKSINPLIKYIDCFNIDLIVDCNQWINLSSIHCLNAKIFRPDVKVIGFSRANGLSKKIYDKVAVHSNNVHELVNFSNLIASTNYNENSALKQIMPDLYIENEFNSLTKKILIHMWPSGQRSYLKRWPESYWIELCDKLMAEGFTLYFSGSKNDSPHIDEFSSKLKYKNHIDLSGTLSLLDLANFLRANIDLCISVNTGIMHLAYLSEIPVIGLHGPTDPDRWGPIGRYSVSLLPKKGRFAYLNYGFEYPKSDADAYALQYLSVEQVYKAFCQIYNWMNNND